MGRLTASLPLACLLTVACAHEGATLTSASFPPPSASTAADLRVAATTSPALPSTVVAPGTLPQLSLGVDATILIQAVVAATNAADGGQRTATALDSRDFRVISIGQMSDPEVAAIAQLDNTMVSIEIPLDSPPSAAQVAALVETVRQTGGDAAVAQAALVPGATELTTGSTSFCRDEDASSIVVVPVTMGCLDV